MSLSGAENTQPASAHRAGDCNGRTASPCQESPIASLMGLSEEFLQFCSVLRALANDPGPTSLVGFIEISLSGGAFELDRLNAGVGLTLGILGVLFGENRHRIPFRLFTRLTQDVALCLGELVPDGLVHQDRHLGGIETGIHTIFRLLVPAEIKNAGDRPTVSINNPALESRINLARRGLNDCRSERLEEVAVDRRNAKLEAGQIGTRDRFVQIEMEWIPVDVPGEENRIHLLGIELRHIVVT